MTPAVGPSTAGHGAAVSSPSERAASAELFLLAGATLAVWGHTIDELRIGEFVAVPLGLISLGLLAGWPRLPRAWKGTAALLLGAVWALAVIPYHIVPLLGGAATWQNVSGVLRLVGGVPMVWLGVRELRRR